LFVEEPEIVSDMFMMSNFGASAGSSFSSAGQNVSRKSGNPFFTGSNSSGSGSFLFRSPHQENGGSQGKSFYDTKVDVQVNPVTKTVSQSVRYVPRPSELRELNFWSPTSM